MKNAKRLCLLLFVCVLALIAMAACNGGECKEHNYDEWSTFIPATCESGGIDRRVCTACQEEDLRTINPLGHDLVDHAAKAPTCAEVGFDAYVTCSRCDYSTKTEKPKLAHDTIVHEAKTPTCTEIGWDAYETCKNCDYTTRVEKATIPHDLTSYNGKEPTCTEIGYDPYVACAHCDYTTYKEKEALNHDEIPHAGKEPTCTEGGWDPYVTCSRCDYTTYRFRFSISHNLKTHAAKAPTCTTVGWDAYVTCSRCDYTTYMERNTIPHNYVSRVCTECGDAIPFIDNLYDYDDSMDFSAQEEFVISYFDLYDYEVYGDENSREKLDTLIYNRNKLLEARFGVEISQRGKVMSTGMNDVTSHYNYVQLALTSGDVSFDAIAMYAYNAGKLILGNGGNFLDWRSEVPYCSDSIKNGEEWWPESINRNSTVMGRQFVAVSDFSITAMEMTYAVIFNADLAKNEHVAYAYDPTTYTVNSTLYDLVRNNDWTLETMKTIVKGFYKENATDGKRNEVDDKDRFGLVAPGGTDADAWAYALGFNYILNDGVSTPTLWEWDGTQYDAIMSLRELYESTGTWKNTVGASRDDYYARFEFFAQEDRVLFQLNTLESLKYDVVHNMEQGFGILPYPKYDANQAKYQSGSLDRYSALAVPFTACWNSERLRMTGALIEALSAENCNSVKNAYFEDLATHHNVTDRDAIEMINIIMDGRVYDLAVYHYNDLTLFSLDPNNSALALFFRYLISNPHKDIAQHWNSNSFSLGLQLQELLDDYNSIGM